MKKNILYYENDTSYLMSAAGLVQKLMMSLKSLLLQLLNSKLKLVAPLGGLVVLLGCHPSYQAVVIVHLPVLFL